MSKPDDNSYKEYLLRATAADEIAHQLDTFDLSSAEIMLAAAQVEATLALAAATIHAADRQAAR